MRRRRTSGRRAGTHDGERPEGTPVLTPTLRVHSVYRLPGDAEAYQVWHGPILSVSAYLAELPHVVKDYAHREDDEDRTSGAWKRAWISPMRLCTIVRLFTRPHRNPRGGAPGRRGR